MLTITPALKKHMTEKFGVAADAADDIFRKAVSEKIVTGDLSLDAVTELTKSVATDAELRIKSMIEDGVKAGIAAHVAAAATTTATAGAPAGTGAKAYAAGGIAGAAGTDGAAAFDASYDQVSVKNAIDQYNDSRTAATWDKSSNGYLAKAFAGKEIGASHCEDLPYTLDMPTERSKAIAGVWFKHMALRAMKRKGMSVPEKFQLREHEMDILKYAAHNCKFVGDVGGTEYEGQKLANGMHTKTVLDDSTSGGLEAVPIEFDASVILTPLLNGELFPLVNLTNVNRRRIEAAKIGNPTMSWGTASGTAISLFDTDSFISAFDNTIYPLTGATELGLDFLADSPLAVGNIVVQRYGERFKQEMDNVIVSGNGTNQPEGIFTASGVSTVTPASAGNAAQVGDYEGLMFGVGKEYLSEAGMPPNSRAVFIGTQTTYQRARSIPVDSSNDARRIFGMDQMDYRLFGFRYAINSSITNVKIAFACLNRYRMYRRLGLEVRLVSEDWSLARANKEGLVIRSRFGGALELAGAATKITASQA